MKRLLGATAAYYLGTLLALAIYRSPLVTARWAEQTYRGKV